MHLSSKLKMEAFLTAYASDSKGKTVLDIGSRSVRNGGNTYRTSTDQIGLIYTGLDMEHGFNVDIVPTNPYIWNEIANEQFDFVISGQAFEHNPFMWITFCEIARILKPGGRAFIIAPSAGAVHRYPFDCWRYYPDSWAALCSLTGLELTESIREVKLPFEIGGGRWVDSAGVGTKPHFSSQHMRDDFYRNLAEITAPFKARRYDVKPATVNEGPCFQEYLALVKQQTQLTRPERQRAPAGLESMSPLMSPLMSPQLSPRRTASVADRGAEQAARSAGRGNQNKRVNHSVRRINRIAQLVGAQSYLEIGVSKGHTFNSLEFPRKIAVDPQFRFDLAEYRRIGVDLFETTSDMFFANFAGSEKFDVIFIDGLHVFQQAYRDFCNSLKHAHDRTVWLIDDVVPSDEFSALPDPRETQRRRRQAGISSHMWHGDVYKVVFAIHDFQPNYRFVTVNTGGNPQTIVWKAPRQKVVPALGSIEAIEKHGYADFLKRQDVMNMLPEDEAFQVVLASIGPEGRAV